MYPFSKLWRVKRELWPRNQLFESRYCFRIALNLFALNNSTAGLSKQIRTNSCCFIQILICIMNFLSSNLYRDFFYPEFLFFFAVFLIFPAPVLNITFKQNIYLLSCVLSLFQTICGMNLLNNLLNHIFFFIDTWFFF